MSTLEQIKQDIIASMKSGDKVRTGALRLVSNELQKDQKEGKGDEIAVLQRERKRRLESVDAYVEAGRDEQAEAERYEAELIQTYLPEQLSEDNLKALIEEAVSATGASTPKEMGKVMGYLKPKVAGRADGRVLSGLVKQRLA